MKTENTSYLYTPVVSLLAILIVNFIIVITTHQSWNSSIQRYIPLKDHINKIDIDLSSGHLWLEEAITGDKSVDVDKDVLTRFRNTYENNSDFINKNQSKFSNADDRILLDKLEHTINPLLVEFYRLATQRWLNIETSKVGSTHDQLFDEKFNVLNYKITELRLLITHRFNEDLKQRNEYFIIILTLFIIANIVILIAFYFYMQKINITEKSIKQSRQLLNNVITGSGLGYWDWNYQTGAHEVNDRWLDMLGLSRDDIVNNVSDWEARIHPDDKQRMIDTVENAIKERKPYTADFRMKHKNGHWVWIQGAGSLIESHKSTKAPLRLCGTHQDINARKELEKELKYRATHDDLTGLYNRIELERHILRELERSERYKHQLSIFMIDIDHFKQINDNHGHQMGDHVLQKFAIFLQDKLRTTDYVARYGGEEFIIILHETSNKEALELAERLRENIETLAIEFNNITLKFTISIGISTYPENGTSYEILLNCADSAMYQAKNSGRNRVHSAKL